MLLLKCLGYTGLSMRDLEPYLQGKRQGRVVGITFDDGYRNNLQNALPVLIKHGFTATCYAVTSMIGGVNSWDRDIGVAQKPLMTADEWGAWLNSGMDVGSHTRTHGDLTTQDADKAQDQICVSKQELENALCCEARHFCYPYGRFDAAHRQMVQHAGYVTATTTNRGRVHTGDDPYTLRRIMVSRVTHLALFAAKVVTAYEDRRS
jgi:peptidoglycan/xylan/chitin deacetylase (PgdA/CDA1 family)